MPLPLSSKKTSTNKRMSTTNARKTNARGQRKYAQVFTTTPVNYGEWFDDDKLCWEEARSALKVFKLTQLQCEYRREKYGRARRLRLMLRMKTSKYTQHVRTAEAEIKKWTPVPEGRSFDLE